MRDTGFRHHTDADSGARHSATHPSAGSARTRARRRQALLLLPGVALALAPSVAAAAPAAEVERGAVERSAAPRGEDACETGEFCLWPEAGYGGTMVRLDLRNTNPDECAPLPDGMSARSFVNRVDRHVTVYQDAECSTEADFSTYPGPDTFVPRSPYVVRAVQIWH